MKNLKQIFLLLTVMTVLPKISQAYPSGCDPETATIWTAVCFGFAGQVLPAGAQVATGIAASVYSAHEYQKDNLDSKNPSLASTVLNPIGSSFAVIALVMNMLDRYSKHSTDLGKKYTGASSMMALLATGFFVGSSIASGVAYGANRSSETAKAMGLSLASGVISLLPAAWYSYRHLKQV